MTQSSYDWLLWNQPAWKEQARAWIVEQLERLGLALVGEISQPHVRPWSTVMKAATVNGDVYFKAVMPALGYEAALTRRLAALRPDCVLRVLASDEKQGWMLMPDEGVMLRNLVKTTSDMHHWETILPRFAGLQIEMAAHRQDLLDLGVLDRRLAGLPDQLRGLMRDRAGMMVDQPDGLTAQQYARMHELLPRFTDLCAQLASSGIPETLHHDDFHDANVFVSGHPGELRYAFSDWAESCITHPFFTLLVTLRSIAYRLDLAYGAAEHNFVFAPELVRLRDVYLEAWTDYGSMAQLRITCDAAWRAAMVNRSLTWHRVITAFPPNALGEQSAIPAIWLQEFLDLADHDS